MNKNLIKKVVIGWFCFCYAGTLILLPVFPFVTTGFDWKIALVILFATPLLFMIQGLMIAVMINLGLIIYNKVRTVLNLSADWPTES